MRYIVIQEDVMKGLIIIFLLLSAICYADNMTGVFVFEIGYLPFDPLLNDNSSYFSDSLSFYSNFNIKITIFDLIFIGGGMLCHFVNDVYTNQFFPYMMDYRFEIGFKIDGFSIGFRHNCYHPVAPYNITLSNMNAAFEEIYIRFESKIKIF